MQSRMTLQLTVQRRMALKNPMMPMPLPLKSWDYACAIMPSSQEFEMSVKKKKSKETLRVYEFHGVNNWKEFGSIQRIHFFSLKNGLFSLLDKPLHI